MVLAAYSVSQVVYTLLWLFAFFVEIWLMVTIFIDIFRSDDLSGWAKAGWVLFIIIIPILGILAYLVVRGNELRVHHRGAWSDTAAPSDRQARPSASPPDSKAAEIAHLADLRDHGDITADEFERLKAEVIARESR